MCKQIFATLQLSTHPALEIILTSWALHGERLGKAVENTKHSFVHIDYNKGQAINVLYQVLFSVQPCSRTGEAIYTPVSQSLFIPTFQGFELNLNLNLPKGPE